MAPKFFHCKQCGKILTLLADSGTPTVCCGEEMRELTANTSDGATEKHVPAVKVVGNNVEAVVGSVPHPMLPEHYIQWIYLHTKKGGQFKYLQPGEEPKASYELSDDELIAVYEYCNLHGLWKYELA